MKKHATRKRAECFHFTLIHELQASSTKPVPEARLNGHLMRVHQGLESLERDVEPHVDAWRDMSDAVNILESLVEMGIVSDDGDQITAAKNAMGQAGARHLESGALRLSGEGIQVMRGLLEDYGTVVQALTERQFVSACRRTERRVRQILRGCVRPGDKVVAL